MKNLGNVAGIVQGYDPPLESDGVTEKRYVIWAKTLNTTPVSYKLMYYDVFKSGWFPIVGVSESDFNLLKYMIFGSLNNPDLAGEFDKDNLLDIVRDVKESIPDLSPYVTEEAFNQKIAELVNGALADYDSFGEVQEKLLELLQADAGFVTLSVFSAYQQSVANSLAEKVGLPAIQFRNDNYLLSGAGNALKITDIMQNIYKNDGALTSNRILNLSGFTFSYSGLVDRSSDASWSTLLGLNASGTVGRVNGWTAMKAAMAAASDTEKEAWRLAQRKTGETYSTGQPRVDFVFPSYINNSLTYVQPLVLYGINLYIDNQTPNSIVRLNRVEDINGNAVNDLYDVTNFEVSPLKTNQIVLMLNWSLYPKGKYKFKVINNTLQSLVSEGTVVLNDTVPNVISNLTWQVNTNPSQAANSSFLNISNKTFSYERRVSSGITEPTHTMISNETLTGNFVVELNVGLGETLVYGGAIQNVYNLGLIAASSASTSFALSVLNGFEFKWEWDYGGVNITDKGYFKDQYNTKLGSGGKIYLIKFQGYITICFVTSTGNAVYLSSAVATTEPMKLFNSFYNQGRYLGKTVNFSYGQIFTY